MLSIFMKKYVQNLLRFGINEREILAMLIIFLYLIHNNLANKLYKTFKMTSKVWRLNVRIFTGLENLIRNRYFIFYLC